MDVHETSLSNLFRRCLANTKRLADLITNFLENLEPPLHGGALLHSPIVRCYDAGQFNMFDPPAGFDVAFYTVNKDAYPLKTKMKRTPLTSCRIRPNQGHNRSCIECG